MLTGFAILGLTLASIGTYGVITRTMAQRQHEFGIRLARLLQAGFPNLHLQNPGIVVAATLLLVAVALLACYPPARRAGRINPDESLRAD